MNGKQTRENIITFVTLWKYILVAQYLNIFMGYAKIWPLSEKRKINDFETELSLKLYR